MKNNIKILITTLFLGLFSTSCEEFLDVPPDATLTEEEIFSTYNTFQGFVDPCYDLIADPNNFCLVGSTNMACESISASTASPVWDALNCNYLRTGTQGRSIWMGQTAGTRNPLDLAQDGLYDFWPVGCRIANLALANLDLLTKGTQEEKDILEGQALFFRAYLNFQVLCAYGSIPYLDQVYDETNIKQPRYYTDEATGKKNYQAASEKAARDLRRAADLLPVAWGDQDLGRITKGACLALLTKVLLYAGSPLMEEVANNGVVSSGETGYNKDYMKRAAETAVELFNLGEYELTPFGSLTTGYLAGEGYRSMFNTIDGTKPYTKEVIFQKFSRNNAQSGRPLFASAFMRIYAKGPLAGTSPAGGLENPLIEFMDKFEMKDGTQYKPGNTNVGGYDDNKQKFFKERDPRFDFNYYLHEEKVGTYTCSFENKGSVYSPTMRGPFLMTKYWYPGADAINNQYGKYLYSTPILRLADVYLMYAEAVFENTGSEDGSIAGGPTARQALNMVRDRVSMPDYNPSTYAVARPTHGELASDPPFRLAYRNERAVELAYEGHQWWDLRRWKRMHRLNSNVYILDFNKAFTTSSRVLMQTFPFELKHYWLPFRVGDTQVYEGYEQNPGW